jgi:hypothetical protein
MKLATGMAEVSYRDIDALNPARIQLIKDRLGHRAGVVSTPPKTKNFELPGAKAS